MSTAATSPKREPDSQRALHFDTLARSWDRWRAKNRYYYDSVQALVHSIVPPGSSVLEIGCADGELLASLRPSCGVGLDVSPQLIELARKRHPELSFHVLDGTALAKSALAGQTFDYIVLADTLGYVDDVWALMRAVRKACHEDTRVFISYYNFVWEPVLRLGSALGMRMPVSEANWLGMADLVNLLELNHFDVVHNGHRTLLPKRLLPGSDLINRYVADVPGLRHLALTQYLVARPRAVVPPSREYSCTVVVPCRNERGNIAEIVARTPRMGRHTELLFVDGRSEDGTVAAIEAEIARGARPDLTLRLLHQGEGKGKGDAVRKGFAAATGELLFILDADLTVPPEDLPKFYTAIVEGQGEFINGSRLVYPMERGAMRLLNLGGNRVFGLAVSSIIRQRLKDTLCGTKVLLKRDYEKVIAARRVLGDLDPFGDFDLLFGAARANLKIAEVPIRYEARRYGETKISRFSDGWMLLRMVVRALDKFRP